jgi:hypothetical protein
MGLREMLWSSTDEKSVSPTDVADQIDSEIDIGQEDMKTVASRIDEKSDETGVDSVAVTNELAEQYPQVDEKILGRLKRRINEWLLGKINLQDRDQALEKVETLEVQNAISSQTADEARDLIDRGRVDEARQRVLEDPQILEELDAGGFEEVPDVGMFAEKMDTDEKTAETLIGTIEQKQMDGDNPDDEEMNQSSLDMLNEEARETVKDYADLVGKDPEDCVSEVMDEMNGGQPDVDEASYEDKDGEMVTEGELDEKLAAHTEEVADAVVSDEVIDRIAGEVSQKMLQSEDFQEGLVETVDEKGDFGSTPTPSFEAPADGKTARDAILGGDN